MVEVEGDDDLAKEAEGVRSQLAKRRRNLFEERRKREFEERKKRESESFGHLAVEKGSVAGGGQMRAM